MCFSASPPYYTTTLLQNFLEEEENFVTLFLQYLFFIAFQYYPRAGRFLSAKQRPYNVATFRYDFISTVARPGILCADNIKYIFKVYGHLLFECNEKDDGTGSEILRERRREVSRVAHRVSFFALDLPWGDL